MNEALIKRTNYSKSISLQQEEFDALMAGQYEAILVESMTGKFIKKIPKSVYPRLLSRAQIDLVNHDPNGKHYWIVNI